MFCAVDDFFFRGGEFALEDGAFGRFVAGGGAVEGSGEEACENGNDVMSV